MSSRDEAIARGGGGDHDRYRALFNAIDQGFCVCRLLVDADGKPFDYRFLEVNPVFARHTGLEDAAGKTALQLVPDLEPHWIHIYGAVALTGESVRFVQRSAVMRRWFRVHAFPFGAPGTREFAILFSDITDRTLAESARRESDERTRLAVAVARLGTWRFDPSTGLVHLDERMREIWGEQSAVEAIPLGTVLARIHPADRERVASAIDAALAPPSEGKYAVEYRIVWPDGSVRWLEANGQAQFAGDSDRRHPVTFIGTALDVTDRKNAEERLRADVSIRKTLGRAGASFAADLNPETLVQAVTDAGTAATDAQFGAFFYNVVNAAGEAYQLYALSGAPRETFQHFPHPRATAILGPTFRGERIVRLDDVTKDPRYGQSAPYHGMPRGHLPVRSYLAVPVVGRSGVLGGLFFGHADPGVFTADHERLAAGIASWAAIAFDNARLYQEATAANRVKDEFLATLSHELRTPLNAVLGWAHLLRAGTMKPDLQQRALESIERNARAQAQLVDDLLDVSRITSGKLRINADAAELMKAVGDAADAIRPAAAAKRISLVTPLDATPRIVVTGDADRLQQIVWNLLSNAVKFTPSGGRVELAVRPGDAHVDIVVSDSGQGIAPSFLPHLFERFRQSDSSTARTHGGLGLGLSIVRHLTEAHGGSVMAESAGEGQGATFIVRLPLPVAEAARRPDGPQAAMLPPRLGGARVLVVDDEEDARELVRQLLESHGARVTTAESAGEAVHLFGRMAFDLLLADIGMPAQDGHSLIRAVRDLPKEQGGEIPAIAVTAYASVPERDRALQSGYDWHVPKPVDPAQLASVVATALAGRIAGDRR